MLVNAMMSFYGLSYSTLSDVVFTEFLQMLQRSKVKVALPINAETESVSPTNFKLGRRLVHALSTTMVGYKGL